MDQNFPDNLQYNNMQDDTNLKIPVLSFVQTINWKIFNDISHFSFRKLIFQGGGELIHQDTS